jgi:AcrR family transcriptional regulator
MAWRSVGIDGKQDRNTAAAGLQRRESFGCSAEGEWEKGFEVASLDDLTKAMGISRPSMYAAFGNKESLFRQALDRYFQGPASYLQEP